MSWRARAACRGMDPEWFHPGRGGRDSPETARARLTCASCEVREDCLAYALDADEELGIWGGLSRQAREKLARRERAS